MPALATKTSAPDALLGWMGSLSDPTRLRLLRLLEREELGVVDLCDVLQMPQSTVSRHLKVLSDQGWLRSRRRGTTRLYRTVLDELEQPARELWLVARGQTDAWATTRQDALRLKTRLSERNAAAKQFFSGKAGEWDRLRSEYYGAGWETAALLALLPADYVVADLGCGTGSTLAALAGNVHTAVGVDNNAQMLKAAARRTANFDNIDLRTGDLENLPLTDGEANAAILSLVLGYLDEPTDVLAEMARVIEPGGKAVIVDLLPHDRDDIRDQLGQVHAGISEEMLGEALKDVGLVPMSYTALPPADDAKGPALFLATATQGGL
ncbi:MAG: metalloregulator ArsR/SmtB family transcription factor [Planctomycetota bacterium]